MPALKRTVISEVLLVPSVLWPLVGGVAAGLLAWASGGNVILSLVAAVGILGGIGWMLLRSGLQVEKIANKAMQAAQQSQRAEENRQLDALAEQLRTDRDHRTQDYLSLLRSLRSDFEAAAAGEGVRIRSAHMSEQLSLAFNMIVDQLRQSYRLWERSEQLVGETRENTLAERETLLSQTKLTLDRYQAVVDRFRAMVKKEEGADLKDLQQELEATLRIARRTEERMQELEKPTASYNTFTRE